MLYIKLQLPNHIVAFVQQEMDDGVVKKGIVKCNKNICQFFLDWEIGKWIFGWWKCKNIISLLKCCYLWLRTSCHPMCPMNTKEREKWLLFLSINIEHFFLIRKMVVSWYLIWLYMYLNRTRAVLLTDATYIWYFCLQLFYA